MFVRFNRDLEYEKDYIMAIQKYKIMGYARGIEEPETTPGFYLSHYGIYKKSLERKREEKKIRIFSIQPRFLWANLNDTLLTGPPLQNFGQLVFNRN